MTTDQYNQFSRRIMGLEFKNVAILETALTHRSWLNEHRKLRGLEHNERLEFLGDAVLELVTTDYLFRNFPKQPEGILTNWRSALVRTESIGAVADRLGAWDMLHLSRGEKQANDRARVQIMANTFEALVGALYLDQGYEAAKAFITNNLLVTLDEIIATGSWQDPKSQYQEQTQAQEGITPSYKVISEEGPDHDKIFTVGVYVEGDLRGQGSGPSKQIAQQAAAQKAIGSSPRPKQG